MGIEKIDSNFASSKVQTEGEKKSYSIPCAPFELYGVWYDEKNGRFIRADLEVTGSVSKKLCSLARHTSGGRVRFSTDSTYFGVEIGYSSLNRMSHMPLLGSGGMILLEEAEDGTPWLIKNFQPSYTDENGYSASVKLCGGKMRNYILYLPLYNDVQFLRIELDATAEVKGGRAYRDLAPIVYYGSSITQGGCASRPDNCYQAHISRWNNVDYLNLGFSGNGRGEPIMARYIGGLACSLFVMDYDYNAPNVEYLAQTHFDFYQAFRSMQPDTPVLFISKPNHARDPRTTRERMAVIRASYRRAREMGDKNVYFLSGQTLFGKDDVYNCTVDGTHPNDLGFYRMAKKIYQKMKQIDVKFQ